jgi:hypothetical protein
VATLCRLCPRRGRNAVSLGVRPIAKTIAAQSWIATPCRVLQAEVRSHDGDDWTTYSVYILYQYEFNGGTYKSDRYDFVGGSSSGYRGKALVVAGYETAAQPVCYVNPRNPYEAVLKRGFHAKLLLAIVSAAVSADWRRVASFTRCGASNSWDPTGHRERGCRGE